MSRTRRRPRKGPSFLFMLIILGLLVFLGADNFGFNWFNFKVDLNNSSDPAKSTNSNSDNASKKASKSQYANIVIKDDQITFNESIILLDKLSDALDQLDKNEIIINLMDNGAYNTTFTDVEDLIKEKNMKYIVSTIKSQ